MQNLPMLESDLDEILKRSEDDLRCLLQGGVLVTGGSGFVGRWIVSALLHAAEKFRVVPRIVSINRTTSAWQAAYIETRQLTVLNADIANVIPLDNQFDCVFHCATPSSALFDKTTPIEMKRVREMGAENVIRLFLGSSARIVNVSSGAVYGVQPADVRCLDDDWLRDSRFALPISPYHYAKVAAERRFNEALETSALDVVHARLFAFLAPFLPLDRQFAAGNFLNDAMANRPITITGDGRTTRTYMYGTDLVVWLVKAAVHGESGSAYNVGSPHEITIEGLATRIAEIYGSMAGVRHLGRPDLTQPAHRYVPCTVRTEQALGVHLDVPLDAAIERTVRWLQNATN